MLLTTVIYFYFAYILQISSKFTVRFLRLGPNVLKTWHLKCELSNIARVRAAFFPNHVPFPNILLYNRKILRLIELMILPITSHRGCGHRTHRTWIRSTTKYMGPVGCAPRTRVPYPDSRRWPSEAATYRRVESLRLENHWPSSASVACSTACVCPSKRRPLWAQTVTNNMLRDFSMLESWVFSVII